MMNTIKHHLAIALTTALLTGVAPASMAAETTSYTYGDYGVTDIDGPRTDVTDIIHIDYDNVGNISAITNPLGQKWQYLDYNAEGQPTRIVDANGITTTLTYEAGRVVSLSRAGLSWGYQYNAVGLLEQSTDPANLVTKRVYDDARRLTEVDYPDGSVLSLTPDVLGSITNATLKQADGTVVMVSDRTYDELGRLLKVINSEGTQSTAYDAQSNPTSGVDGRNKGWLQKYDALNRLTTYRDTAGTSTRYAYNAQDQITKVTDANGGATYYTYNVLNHLTRLKSADTGISTYKYDDAGNLKNVTDARKEQLTFDYDALNRLTSLKLGDSDTISYVYDELAGGAAIGRLTTLKRTGSTLSFHYQDSGQLDSLTRNYQVNGINASLTQSYQYDEAGRLKQLSYADGVSVGYVYGDDGYITDVTFTAPGVTSGVVASGIHTLPTGAIDSLMLGNGIKMTRHYTTSGLLDSQSWGSESASYQYDGNGNLTGKVGTTTDSFGYDNANRLTKSTGKYNQSYTYDNLGNRLSQMLEGSSRTLTYQSKNNRLAQLGSWEVKLDDAGYPTLINSSKSFSWNELGELQEVQINSVSKGKYSYNGWRQRTAKVVGTNTTFYDYNPQGQLVHSAYYTSSGKSWSRYYVWLDNQPLMQLQLNYTGSSPRLSKLVYLHTDQLNAPTAASDKNGVIAWRWDHDAFGVGAVNQDPDGDKSLVDIQLRFPGQIEDSETGLFYNWHRYYDPTTGRYISSDPIGLEGGVNTYGYVEGNPFGYVDPLGLYSWGEFKQDAYDYVKTSVDMAQSESASDALWRMLEGIGPEAEALNAAGRGLSRALSADFKAGKSVTLCEKGAQSGAESAKQAADLSKHLGYSQKYGQAGVKELENGRIRYYGEVQSASKPGEMSGRRYVHEFDPATGGSRGWHETLDHSSNVRQVRPEMNNGSKTHYTFDQDGNYTGSW